MALIQLERIQFKEKKKKQPPRKFVDWNLFMFFLVSIESIFLSESHANCTFHTVKYYQKIEWAENDLNT